MIELLRKRRSIRRFTTGVIPPEAREALVEAALRSPSSRGINPWEFILVDDPDLLGRLSIAKQHGAEFLKGAPLAIVVCADSTHIGCVGRGLLHCGHHHSADRRFPGARQLLGPDPQPAA